MVLSKNIIAGPKKSSPAGGARGMCGIPGWVGVGTHAMVIAQFSQQQYNFGTARYAGLSATQDDLQRKDVARYYIHYHHLPMRCYAQQLITVGLLNIPSNQILLTQ